MWARSAYVRSHRATGQHAQYIQYMETCREKARSTCQQNEHLKSHIKVSWPAMTSQVS